MLELFCFLFYFGRTYFHLLSTGIIDRCVLPCLLYAGLEIEHRAVCMLDTLLNGPHPQLFRTIL